jgi:hypothetical protein
MKSFTYVAAIALLTAGTAFAQAQSSGAAAGANGSTINNSTPTPAAKGAAEGAPRASSGTSSGTMMNQSGSGSMDKSGSGASMGGSGSSMDQSSDMDHSGSKSMKSSSRHSRTHHVASARSSGNDAKENQETMQLNRQQVAGGSSSMNNSMGSGNMGSRGMSSSNPANPFDNGSPQQAQAGGANCTPDNPSCGTARQNPAIQSSPQHRTYGDQQQ